jgi:hypothetical protein
MPNDKIEQADQSFGRLVSLMRSPQFKNAVKKIDSDPQALDAAVKDPKGFLTSQQVQVDNDMDVKITKGGSWSLCATLFIVSVCYEFN